MRSTCHLTTKFARSQSGIPRHIKAFDKFWHKGLLFKLEQNGIDGKLPNLLANYLTNRRQRVVLNDNTSERETIKSDVPQGSVLVPFLFLIYINRIEKNIKPASNFSLTIMLYSIVRSEFLSASEVNHDLKLIHDWAYQWRMSFNPDPNKHAVELIFS